MQDGSPLRHNCSGNAAAGKALKACWPGGFGGQVHRSDPHMANWAEQGNSNCGPLRNKSSHEDVFSAVARPELNDRHPSARRPT